MKTKKQSLVLFTGLALIAMVSQGAAQVENDTDADITVSVSDRTAIDVSPESLDFGSVRPGENVTAAGTYSDLEIENVGSTNVSNLYFNTSNPADNPFGTGQSSQYDVGNWIQIAPQEDQLAIVPNVNQQTFVNRVDFNESNDLSYVSVPNGWHYGRFRVGAQELFWAAETTETGNPETAAQCADTLRVGQNAHNRTATGSVNLDTGSYDTYTLTAQGGYAVADSVTIDVPNHRTRDYSVLVDCSGTNTKTIRTKYNANAEGVDVTGGAAEYIIGPSEDFTPGSHFTTAVSVNVPRGVASTGGSPITGVLNVVAQASN